MNDVATPVPQQELFPFRKIICLNFGWLLLIFFLSFITSIIIYRYLIFQIQSIEFKFVTQKLKSAKQFKTILYPYYQRDIDEIADDTGLNSDMIHLIMEFADIDYKILHLSAKNGLYSKIIHRYLIYGTVTYISMFITLIISLNKYLFWKRNVNYKNGWNYYITLISCLMMIQPYLRLFRFIIPYCMDYDRRFKNSPFIAPGTDRKFLSEYKYSKFLLIFSYTPFIYAFIFALFCLPISLLMCIYGFGLSLIVALLKAVIKAFFRTCKKRSINEINPVAVEQVEQDLNYNSTRNSIILQFRGFLLKYLAILPAAIFLQYGLYLAMTVGSIIIFKTRDIVGWYNNSCNNVEWTTNEIFFIITWILF